MLEGLAGSIRVEAPRRSDQQRSGDGSVWREGNTVDDLRKTRDLESVRVQATASPHLNALEIQSDRGTQLVLNEQGQLAKQSTVDQKLELRYGDDKKCYQVKENDHVWISGDGLHFTDAEGAQRTLSFNKDFSCKFEDSQKAAASGQAGLQDTEKTAEAIRKATGNDNVVARWADREAINQLLENKSQDKRDLVDKFYRQKYGVSLEQEMRGFETGSDLDKFLNVLHKKDDNLVSQNAGRIHEDLLEFGNAVERRDRPIIEKDIRDTLSSMTSEQIKRMDAEYSARYGTSLEAALSHDSRIAPSLRDSLSIYLKGNDLRTDADAVKLAGNALVHKNVAMFEEVMRDAPASVRSQFTEKSLKPYFHGYELKHALDYVQQGRLDAATEVRENTGHIVNDEKGIELAIERMTAEEQKQFIQGKHLSEGQELPQLNPEEREKATSYYNKIHTSLTEASNATNVAKWEDKLAYGDSGLLSNLAGHRGVLYNDSADTIKKDFENMTEKDWQDFTKHPERRESVKEILDTLKGARISDADVADLMQSFDQKVHAPYQAPKEQPTQDALLKLQQLDPENLSGSDVGDAITAIQKAFKQDPTLRERIANPKTAEDIKVSTEFKQAAQDGLSFYYDQVAKPLIETGQVPIENRLNLRNGLFGKNVEKVCEDIASASPEERSRLREDPGFAKRVLGSLSESERSIAIVASEQGDLKLEDRIRISALGFGGSSQVLAELKGMSPEEFRKAEQDYVRKYGVSFDGDVLAKLSGHDRVEAERVLNRFLSVDERANLARDGVEQTRSGFGSWFDQHIVASGTADQADDALNQSIKATSDQNRLKSVIEENPTLEDMTPKDVHALLEKLAQASANSIKVIGHEETADDNHAASKAAAGEVVTNTAIGAVAIGSLIASGGTDAPLVMALAAGVSGSAIKIGGKMALEGMDYDSSAGNLAKDGALGFVSGFTSEIGPGEIAAAFGIGRQAAEGAVNVSLSQLADAGVTTLLDESGKQVLEKGMQAIVQETLISGANEVDKKALLELADKALGSDLGGASRQEAIAQLAQSLDKNLLNELGGGTTRFIIQHGLNSAGGAVGGMSGGAAEGTLDWDSKKSVQENLFLIAGKAVESGESGLIGGGITSVASNYVRHGISAVKDLGAAAVEIRPLKDVTSDALSHEKVNLTGDATVVGAVDATGVAASESTKHLTSGVSLDRPTSGIGELAQPNGPGVELKPDSVAQNLVQNSISTGDKASPSVQGDVQAPLAHGEQSGRNPRKPLPGEVPVLDVLERNDKLHATASTVKPSDSAPTEKVVQTSERVLEKIAGTDAKSIEDVSLPAWRRTALAEQIKELHASGSPEDILQAERLSEKLAVAKDTAKAAQQKELWEKTSLEFPERPPTEMVQARKLLEQDLSETRASGSASVLDRINESNLTQEQRERVLNTLADVREHFVGIRDASGVNGDQLVNWIHTQTELGAALDAAAANNTSGKQLELTLLGSMLSDADKTKANFFVHHVAGARAANVELLRRVGDDFTADDIGYISQSIMDHQLGPPQFMAMFYGGEIKRAINSERKEVLKELSAASPDSLTQFESGLLKRLSDQQSQFDDRVNQLTQLNQVLKVEGHLTDEQIKLQTDLMRRNADGPFVTDADREPLSRLQKKMSDPYSQNLETSESGLGRRIVLKPDEKTMLERAGVSEWTVPFEGRELLAFADSSQYFKIDGYAKYAAIRGPETGPFFKDKTIEDSIESARESGRDCYGGFVKGRPLDGSDPYGVLTGPEGDLGRSPHGIMDDAARQIARKEAHETEHLYKEARSEVEDWLRQRLRVPEGQPLPDVPYWNKPLAYPQRTPLDETEWWRVNNKPINNRSQDEQKFLTDHRFDGMTEQQIEDFKFAKTIRDEMVIALRRASRLDGSNPGSFPTARMAMESNS
jgi:hypothetical protein